MNRYAMTIEDGRTIYAIMRGEWMNFPLRTPGPLTPAEATVHDFIGWATGAVVDKEFAQQDARCIYDHAKSCLDFKTARGEAVDTEALERLLAWLVDATCGGLDQMTEHEPTPEDDDLADDVCGATAGPPTWIDVAVMIGSVALIVVMVLVAVFA